MLVETSINLVEAEAREAKATIVPQLDNRPLLVIANSVQIQQVVVNLLRNALEAIVDSNANDRKIFITTLEVSPGLVEVSVVDKGPGLSAVARSNLFKPFATSKQAGLGLGLSLSRGIISAHGGELWLDETTTGSTRFAFTLRKGGAQR
jgi:two-component system sensor kinase FixL